MGGGMCLLPLESMMMCVEFTVQTFIHCNPQNETVWVSCSASKAGACLGLVLPNGSAGR